VQKAHVSVEVYFAAPLHRVLYIQVVTLFKQNRRLVNEHTIQNRVQSHLVLGDVWFDLMSEIVVNGVSHVIRLKVILESFLVNLVVLKHFAEDVQAALPLICVKPNLEDTF